MFLGFFFKVPSSLIQNINFKFHPAQLDVQEPVFLFVICEPEEGPPLVQGRNIQSLFYPHSLVQELYHFVELVSVDSTKGAGAKSRSETVLSRPSR